MSSKLKSQPMFSPPRLSARFTLLALVALSALLLCSVVFAQTSVSDGSISGTVTDASGAVVPNAKVTMTGPTGQTVHATTSGAGTYSSGALVPGTYSVRAEAKGFKTTQLSVDVQVNNTANGSIKLEIGQESTVVEVQASEVGVNTEQAEVQGVLTASQISTAATSLISRNWNPASRFRTARISIRPKSATLPFRSAAVLGAPPASVLTASTSATRRWAPRPKTFRRARFRNSRWRSPAWISRTI